MEIVRVTYTTRTEFAEQNKVNIRQVMADLQSLNTPGILYTSCLADDGKSFMYTAFFHSPVDHQTLNDLPSFQYFQRALKAAGLESPPKQDLLTLIGASRSLFNP